MIGGIIQNAWDVVVLIILFGLTIFIHELGHFLVALRCGLVVETFSIGFGPAIWSRKFRGVVYKVGCIPFGGYVSLPQIDPTGMSRIQGESGEGGRPLKPIEPWKKMLVSVAGAGGNVILAFILAGVIWLSPNAITYEGSTVVGEVDAGTAAYENGLRPGDRIVAVNGKTVRVWEDVLTECLLIGEGPAARLSVVRGPKTLDIPVPLLPDGKLFLLDGVQPQPPPCIIKGLMPDGSAVGSGLKAGDVVVSFDGEAVRGIEHFQEMVNARVDQECPIVIRRNGEQKVFTVVPRFNEEAQRALIGVKLASVIMPWMRFKNPGRQVLHDASGIVRILRALVTPRESGKAAGGLGGPVAIFAALWVSIKISFMNAVGFLRFLNMNLAILNLLPIPVLDGGHILFAVWETITRKRVHPKVANVLVNAFAFLLILAMLGLTVRDVRNVVIPWVKALFGSESAVTSVQTNDTGSVRADLGQPGAPTNAVGAGSD